MAWRPHSRAFVSPKSPQAWARCDRCSFNYNHNRLSWQMQYGGQGVYNTRYLVCQTCLDDPQPQLQARILPPDPVSIMNARPEPFEIEENAP